MKATNNQLFGNPFSQFDRSKASAGFSVSMLVTERQQDVFYLALRVYCPALLDPPMQTTPVRLDGRTCMPLEGGGLITDAQAVIGRENALLVARTLHARVCIGLHNVFDLFREQPARLS